MKLTTKILIGVVFSGAFIASIVYFWPIKTEQAQASSPSLWNRLWSTGFEWQSTTAGVEWNTTTGTMAIDTTTKHAGAASLRFNLTNATGNIRHRFRADSTAIYYVRFYLLIHTAPGAQTVIFKTGDGSYNPIAIRLNTDKSLAVYIDTGPTQRGSNSPILASDTWYRVELSYDDSSANNTIVAYLNGTQFATGNGDDVGAGGEIFLGSMTSTSLDIYFDDLAVNTGALPGDGKIVIAVPVGQGDSNCTTGTWAMVNEIPPSNTLTSGSTMCELDNNPTNGYFIIASSTTLGIDSYDTISLVYLMARVREDTVGTTNWLMGARSKTGDTASTTTAVDAGDATTVRTNPNSTTAFGTSKILYYDPTTLADWTPTGVNSIDNMQIGVGTTDGSPDTWIATFAAMIEYVDGTAPVGRTPKPQAIIWFN
jgi:hypothetical protein